MYTLLLVGGFCLSANAQVQTSRQNVTSSNVSNVLEDKKMAEIKDCPELDKQLSELFGKAYNLSDPKVKVQLEKNVMNTSASMCIRKKSLYGIYGEEYISKLHLINNNFNLKTH